MNQNRTIFCIGEAIYDIIIKAGKPDDAAVGGALLNTSVSLGRLGMPVEYVGDTGDDPIGELMKAFLLKNGVGNRYFVSYTGSRSRLAIAFIDDINHPRYVFYKLDAPNLPDLIYPQISENSNDIIVFGSFFGIKESIRKNLMGFLKDAKQKGALIIYDPNFRPNHLSLLPKVRSYIEENIKLAHITKGSDDDFKLIFGTTDFDSTRKIITNLGCRAFFYTANRNGIYYQVNELVGHYQSAEIQPVSAIGAGDAFNAGLAYSAFTLDINSHNFAEKVETNARLINKTADEFAVNVCLSMENYIGQDIVNKFQTKAD
ncbi:MAG: hypothetical protein JXR34_04660 [Bacteroidales bacterium]|nr:hypothetical protein [Bacteroidales bacterium]